VSGQSFSYQTVHVGTDWTVRCSAYPGKTPIFSVDAGPVAVAVCIQGRDASESAVEFARELVRQAQVFAAEVERMHAAQAVSVAAKAYRLLRAILMTAVEEDKILPRNPCRIRGAGAEDAAERPVLTVAQVFELAELVGRRPVGNIRKISGGYRLRFRRHGEMRTSPEVFAMRPEAERALWKMASDGRADCTPDRRFCALVLLTTFADLRWGEATALRRSDLDLTAATVRVRAAYVERSTGEMLLGPPKSNAGRRIVGIPDAIIPALRDHLAVFVKDEPGALVFPGREGRAVAARQLQQNVGLAARRGVPRPARAALL
jgi:integrase